MNNPQHQVLPRAFTPRFSPRSHSPDLIQAAPTCPHFAFCRIGRPSFSRKPPPGKPVSCPKASARASFCAGTQHLLPTPPFLSARVCALPLHTAAGGGGGGGGTKTSTGMSATKLDNADEAIKGAFGSITITDFFLFPFSLRVLQTANCSVD